MDQNLALIPCDLGRYRCACLLLRCSSWTLSHFRYRTRSRLVYRAPGYLIHRAPGNLEYRASGRLVFWLLVLRYEGSH